MTANQRRYARLYHDLPTSAPEVYDDDVLLAAYTRLLIAADAVYPALAQVPREVHDDAYARLVETGEVVPGERPYTYSHVRLDEDREARSEQAKDAVRHRKKRPVRKPRTNRPINGRQSTDNLQTNGTARDVTNPRATTPAPEGASSRANGGTSEHLPPYETVIADGRRAAALEAGDQ